MTPARHSGTRHGRRCRRVMVAADPLAGWWRRAPNAAPNFRHSRTHASARSRSTQAACERRADAALSVHARTHARSHASVLSTCARIDTECRQQQLSRRSHSAAGVAWRSGNGSLDSTRSSWRRCSSSSCSLRSLGPATSTVSVRLATERRRRSVALSRVAQRKRLAGYFVFFLFFARSRSAEFSGGERASSWPGGGRCGRTPTGSHTSRCDWSGSIGGSACGDTARDCGAAITGTWALLVAHVVVIDRSVGVRVGNRRATD